MQGDGYPQGHTVGAGGWLPTRTHCGCRVMATHKDTLWVQGDGYSQGHTVVAGGWLPTRTHCGCRVMATHKDTL